MKDKDYFDNVLKSVIDDSVSDIETSRDIFNEAWNKKAKEMNKRKYFNMQFMKRAALVPACCAVITLGGVFTFSPGARAAAQDVLKSIFVLDKSGDIVEQSEDEVDPKYNIGGILITDKNNNETEQKFGFTFNLPEKIGNYSIEKAGKQPFTLAGITANGVKYKDDENLNLKEKFMKAIEDDETFKELNKDYKIERFISSGYEDNQEHHFIVYLLKHSEDLKLDLVKEVNVDNIKCRVLEKTHGEYATKESGGFRSHDMTKKPSSIDKVYYMEWNYDGVSYSIYIGKNSSDIDVAIQFAEDYIKILKQK